MRDRGRLDLDPGTIAGLEKTVNLYEDLVTSCRRNSFAGSTQVLMADGSRKGISEVRRGDRVLAEDPESGEQRPQVVSATYAHDTDRLVDITFADASTLSSTAGHRVYVVERGWTPVSELRSGDGLRSPDGTVHAVSGLRDLAGLAPRTVYDLTVDGLHTFYVRSEGLRAEDLLVHNCGDLGDELLFPDSQAHTLSKHVNPNRAQAEQLARINLTKGLPPVNSVWTSRAVAQEAVDHVLGYYFFPGGQRREASFKALDNFLQKKGQWRNKAEFPITGKFDKYPSLGTVFHADGRAPTTAGQEVRIVLKRLPGKSGHKGYIVYSAYPV